jgi:type II secretory pathway pseudopilin PulG
VLAAVAIVSVALLSLQAVMSQNVDRAADANDRRMGKMLLRQKLEELRSGLETATGGDFSDQGSQMFHWTSQRTERKVVEGQTIEELTVTVSWPTLQVGSDGDAFGVSEGPRAKLEMRVLVESQSEDLGSGETGF